MKIKFKGSPGEDHQGVTMYGVYMPLNKYVEIPEDNVQARRKLSNHPHFEVRKGDEESFDQPVVQPQTIPLVERPVVVSHSGPESVSETELNAINEDPMMKEAGIKADFLEVLEHKEGEHGDDPGPEPESSKKATRPRGN